VKWESELSLGLKMKPNPYTKAKERKERGNYLGKEGANWLRKTGPACEIERRRERERKVLRKKNGSWSRPGCGRRRTQLRRWTDWAVELKA